MIRLQNNMLMDTLHNEHQRTDEINIDLTSPQSIIRNVFGLRSTVGTPLMQSIIGFCLRAKRTKRMINDDLLRILTLLEMKSVVKKSIDREFLQVKKKLVYFGNIRDETMLRLRTIAKYPPSSPAHPFENNNNLL
jgi:hypothetical protein